MRVMTGLVVVLALGYLGVCVAFFFYQRSLIYFPQPRSSGVAATFIKLPVKEAEVYASARVQDKPGAVIYLGGNAEYAGFALDTLSAAFPKHAVYALDYRGYGGSSGTPSEQALQKDALALFDMVHAKHPQIIVVGRSLGSGIATALARERPVSRLVLITPYFSLEELAAKYFPYVPIRWILSDKFESWRHAPHIKAPTIIVVAEHDEIIPRASSEQLHRAFPSGVAAYYTLPGADHNNISAHPLYVETLRRAIESAEIH